MHGILPKAWGPFAWTFLHSIASRHSDVNQDVKRFFTVIGDILPCQVCSEHYKEHIAKYPLTMKEKPDIWLYRIHNLVNDRLNVPKGDRPSIQQVRAQYDAMLTCNFADTGVYQLLYAIAFGHPGGNCIDVDLEKSYELFFRLLPKVLPGEFKEERNKISEFLKTSPLSSYNSRPDMVKWVHHLHKYVSDKSSNCMALRDVKKVFYKGACNSDKEEVSCAAPP